MNPNTIREAVTIANNSMDSPQLVHFHNKLKVKVLAVTATGSAFPVANWVDETTAIKLVSTLLTATIEQEVKHANSS